MFCVWRLGLVTAVLAVAACGGDPDAGTTTGPRRTGGGGGRDLRCNDPTDCRAGESCVFPVVDAGSSNPDASRTTNVTGTCTCVCDVSFVCDVGCACDGDCSGGGVSSSSSSTGGRSSSSGGGTGSTSRSSSSGGATCTETDVAFCARLGKNCGDVQAFDQCGFARQTWCGACQSGFECGGDNVCTALPPECPVCGPNETCNQATATCVCPSVGFHMCGQACSSNASVATCGARCDPCPVPAQGTATCQAGVCGVQCNAGTLLCGGTCATCPSAGVADVACQGTQCVVTACDDGYVPCASGCCALTTSRTFEGTLGSLVLSGQGGGAPVITYRNSAETQMLYWETGLTAAQVMYTGTDVWPYVGVEGRNGVVSAMFSAAEGIILATRNGSAWSKRVLKPSWIAMSSGLTVCPDGTRHGLYESGYGSLADQKVWSVDEANGTFTQTNLNFSVENYTNIPMACDRDGYVHAAYREFTNGDSQVAYRFRAPGSATWSGGPVPGGESGCAVSMWVSDDGYNVHLAFLDIASGALKWAHNNGTATFTVETVESAVSALTYCPLGFETAVGQTSDGKVHLLYKLDEVDTVHYAHGTAGNLTITTVGQRDFSYVGGLATQGNTVWLLIKDGSQWRLLQR